MSPDLNQGKDLKAPQVLKDKVMNACLFSKSLNRFEKDQNFAEFPIKRFLLHLHTYFL
tara:strand:- start:2782 stop:2955 length:174 start_codon:yes stop_codon:yes gene_type:complete